MSFQAYLDNIEEKTGLTPRRFIELAHEKGLDDPAVKAGAIVAWLKDDYDLGRGHAMALVHVIKNGPQIDAKHVDSAARTVTRRTCSGWTARPATLEGSAAEPEDKDLTAARPGIMRTSRL